MTDTEKLIQTNLMEINKKRMKNLKKRKKRLCTSGLVLGIVGTIFAFILPIVTYATSIPGLVASVKAKRRNYSASAGIALNIIGIVLATINSILAAVFMINKFIFGKEKEE